MKLMRTKLKVTRGKTQPHILEGFIAKIDDPAVIPFGGLASFHRKAP